METPAKPKLKLTDSEKNRIIECFDQLEKEKENQRLYSYKDCSDYLNYYLKTVGPDEKGNQPWLSMAPDYSLLDQQLPAGEGNDFDADTDALKLGALELAFSIIENLSMEISWADRSGRSWRETAVFRLLVANS